MPERILSCIIDEAGDFGKYDSHSPYYIVSVVIHEQKSFSLHHTISKKTIGESLITNDYN